PICEAVLGHNDVVLTIGRIIEKRGNETSGVSAAQVHRPGLQRAKNGAAVVQKLLCWPIVSGLRCAKAFENWAPEWNQILGRRICLFAVGKHLEGGINLLPTATFDCRKKALNVIRNLS